MKQKLLLNIMPVFGFYSIILTGCSVIGFGIGTIHDARKPDQLPMSKQKITEINPGTRIIITTEDDEIIVGQYIGLERSFQKLYAKRYKIAREKLNDKFSIPELAQVITVLTTRNREITGTLRGFDDGLMWLRLINDVDSAAVRLTSIEKIVYSQGVTLQGDTLKNLILSEAIPLLSEVTVQTDSGVSRIAREKIKSMQVFPKKNSKWRGLLFGATFDLLIAIILIIEPLDLAPDMSGFSIGSK